MSAAALFLYYSKLLLTDTGFGAGPNLFKLTGLTGQANTVTIETYIYMYVSMRGVLKWREISIQKLLSKGF